MLKHLSASTAAFTFGLYVNADEHQLVCGSLLISEVCFRVSIYGHMSAYFQILVHL